MLRGAQEEARLPPNTATCFQCAQFPPITQGSLTPPPGHPHSFGSLSRRHFLWDASGIPSPARLGTLFCPFRACLGTQTQCWLHIHISEYLMDFCLSRETGAP